jgi:hypothetical protein
MATYTGVDLRIPEAKRLADLHGIATDLQRAQEFARLFLSQFNTEPANWQLVEPLSIAIAVAYARAFSGGVRHHLTQGDLIVLTDAQRASHQFLRDYRDKHIAHSVNEFEENTARANYCQERVATEGITSIGYSGSRLVSLSGREIQAVIEIAAALEIHVRSQIRAEEERLLPIVRAMPLEVVLAGGQKVFQPTLSNVSKPRK